MNTPGIKNQILKAAHKRFKHYRIEYGRINTIFEHGRWWVQFYDEYEEIERTYSVCDAEGKGAIDGFDFEQV